MNIVHEPGPKVRAKLDGGLEMGIGLINYDHFGVENIVKDVMGKQRIGN